MTAQGATSPAGAPPPRRARRTRRARGGGAPSAAAVSAASAATLALAWLILLSAPVPSHGFFRPTTRVKAPPAGPTPFSPLPRNRPFATDSVENGSSRQSRTTAPLLPTQQRLTRRYSGSPLLMSGEDEGGETAGETEEGEEAEEDEEYVQLPTIEVPEMMSEEVSVWVRPGARRARGSWLAR